LRLFSDSKNGSTSRNLGSNLDYYNKTQRLGSYVMVHGNVHGDVGTLSLNYSGSITLPPLLKLFLSPFYLIETLEKRGDREERDVGTLRESWGSCYLTALLYTRTTID